MNVFEYANVDPNTPHWVLRFLGRVLVGVDTEDGEPLACGFLFDRDLFDGRVLGDVSVEVNRNPTDFAQPQHRPATRILEFEVGLVVAKRATLPRWFPFEHPHGMSVLFLRFER